MLGGMGVVYICHDLAHDRPVALKTFKPEYLPNRAARDRFLREGTAWVDLGRHPHIVRCYQVLRSDNGLEVYLALELIAKVQGYPDASLRSWLIPGHPLPVETALLFALQIARGMRYATETIPGFVHRDLKPENVLVGADMLPETHINRLRVTDFGLAAVLESASERIDTPTTGNTEHPLRATQLTHGIVGTPLYMAPEQWQEEPVDVYTDVYALGCILYEMLAGQCVVSGSSIEFLQRAHCTGDLRPIPENLPIEVHQLLTCCLALNPKKRHTSWKIVEEAFVAAYETVTGCLTPQVPKSVALSYEERVQVGWSYNAMGNAYRDIGKAEVAVSYLERAQLIGKTEGERGLEGTAQGNLGNVYKDLGDAQRAIGYYEQHLKIACEIGDRYGEGVTLNSLGNAHRNLGNAPRAVGYHQQALTIACEIGDRIVEGAALSNLGLAYATLGEAQRALEYYEQSLAIWHELGSRREEGNALNNMGEAHRLLGDARCAIGYHEQALAIVRGIGARREESVALGCLGSVYFQLNDMQRAIGYYEQQLVITREIGDQRGEGSALGNLGSAYFQLGEVRRAIGYYERAIAIRREIGNIDGVATDAFNMALLYAQQGESAHALPLAREAARIFARIGSPNAHRAQQLVAHLQGTNAM